MLDAAIEAARLAGGIIRDRIREGTVSNVTAKAENDLLTETDVAADQAVTACLRKRFPEWGVISEESPGLDTHAEYTWIVDPLDATANFIHGYPVVAVSIGLTRIGERILGVVYDPLREELFTARKGEGACLNGEPVRVSGRPDLDGALVGTGFPLRYPSYLDLYLDCFRTVFRGNGHIRRDGCAALNLCYVACGRFDGFWEFLLRPWDLAAGSLIIEEAGGRITDPAGTVDYMASGNVVAGNPAVYGELIRRFGPVLEGHPVERP
jgi:myo-inositol-1(or 4)-monophosphatase